MRHLAALTLVALALTGSPVRSQDANGAFAALTARYFSEQWKLDPVAATEVGVHDYDSELADYSAAAHELRVARAKRYLSEIAAIDSRALAPETGADYEIFKARLERTILDETEAPQRWRHDPSVYTGVAADAIYGLIERDFAPLAARMRFAIARERAIPSMLAAGATNITTVNPTTAQIARGNMAGAISFFSRDVPLAFANVADSALQAQFKSANDSVLVALRDYIAKMSAGPLAHPSGTYALGAELFEKRLALQELTPIPLARYESVGEAALAKTKADFIATARKIDPAKPPEEVAAELGRDHPSSDQLLGLAQRDLDQLRSFVREKRLVTLAPDWDIVVTPTPEFDRETSFASMDSPGPLEKVATKAFYYITTVDPSWSKERQEQHLAFFNNAYRPIVSAHEVMPGHYLNFALNKHQDLSMVRRLMGSPTFSEGWAHYDEQMIVDEGWGNGDPRVRLAMLQGALLRECRYLVGLREHTQGLSVADATKFFMANAFMQQEPARREALRGTEDPLYGYYTLGKLEILKLRADYQKKMGSGYSLQKFHDALLAHGRP
ncbi:MAG: DUF885 domain-containing protein, partial [Candidatus Eremiobacteraeota bacterium]|nr:DUF885 domain-containing protein [Candidatus Eremiobacteraeota bacterium]